MDTASRALLPHEVQVGKKYRVERTFASGTETVVTGVVTNNKDEWLTFDGRITLDVHPNVAMPRVYIYAVDEPARV